MGLGCGTAPVWILARAAEVRSALGMMKNGRRVSVCLRECVGACVRGMERVTMS